MTGKSLVPSAADNEVKSLLPNFDQAGVARSAAQCTTPGKPVVPKRTMGAIKLGFVAFVAVCGGVLLAVRIAQPPAHFSFTGPFGIEEAVAAAGILPTLIALLVLPIIWGLPQALMVSEICRNVLETPHDKPFTDS